LNAVHFDWDVPMPRLLWSRNRGWERLDRLAVIIPYGIQVVVSNFVEPLVFGKRLHLHPIFVLFSLVPPPEHK
jgi:predicted PurR-regulated permease PerM